MTNTNKGFTLIELIVVIAIMAILAAIAVPSMTNILDKAEITADISQLKTLNNVTKAYSISNNIYDRDVFQGLSNDDSRMQLLIDEGYFGEAPTPKVSGESYNWSVNHQLWFYSRNMTFGSNFFKIVFDENFTVEDYIQSTNAMYTATSDGLLGELNGGNGDNDGILFIPNNREEYIITTEAQLSAGDDDGYGILFDTTVGNGDDDNGYIVQFDREPYGGDILIRQRVDGTENSPSYTLSQSELSQLIPGSEDASWWTSQHEIQIQVEDSDTDPTKNTAKISIDGVTVIESFEYTDETDAADNNTGFRVWGDPTIYNSIMVEDIS